MKQMQESKYYDHRTGAYYCNDRATAETIRRSDGGSNIYIILKRDDKTNAIEEIELFYKPNTSGSGRVRHAIKKGQFVTEEIKDEFKRRR